MGSCASIHRKSDSCGKNRVSLVHSETDKNPNSMPCKPVKNNTANLCVGDLPIGPQFASVTSISNYGSKEESFFDSQPWLESDCDDDFYSVRGDFTPSRGNTPIHSSRTLSPQANRAVFEGRSSVFEGPNRSFHVGNALQVISNGIRKQADGGYVTVLTDDALASPTEEKKKNKLGDLFHDSTEDKAEHDEFKNEVGAETPPGSGSRKRTPPRAEAAVGVADEASAACCFPRIIPSALRGFKKTLFSPPISVDA
ncbi:hypothetical protein V2J09_010781 [Rumex salicifolius]